MESPTGFGDLSDGAVGTQQGTMVNVQLSFQKRTLLQGSIELNPVREQLTFYEGFSSIELIPNLCQLRLRNRKASFECGNDHKLWTLRLKLHK